MIEPFINSFTKNNHDPTKELSFNQPISTIILLDSLR